VFAVFARLTLVGSCLPAISILAPFLLGVATDAGARTRTLRAVGVSQLGPNNRCGAPIWSLNGVPVGAESSGAFLGLEHNLPFGGGGPTMGIVQADCDGTTGRLAEPVLATYNSAYGGVRGWIPPDVRLEGLPLWSIPVPAGLGVRAPIPQPGSLPPNPLPRTRKISGSDFPAASSRSIMSGSA
jgi:hypothetical protein